MVSHVPTAQPSSSRSVIRVAAVGDLHCTRSSQGAFQSLFSQIAQTSDMLLLAGDRLYVGNVAGTMTVLRAGRQKEVLARIEMDAPIYSPPAPFGDALYLATANRLYLIAGKF